MAILAQIVDIRADTPKNTDRFLIDTNALYWLFYTRASQSSNPPLNHQSTYYPSYIKQAITAKSMRYSCALSFAELAHNIEKAEREIYEACTKKQIRSKEFRQDTSFSQYYKNAILLINDIWDDVLSISTLLDLTLDSAFMRSALTLFPKVTLDGYDLLMTQAALAQKITQVITDDGDYASVPGITVFTANRRLIDTAGRAGRLLVR